MFAFLLLPAFAETDTIGGESVYNNDGEMMKLVHFSVEEAALVTELQFAVYNNRSDSPIQFVLYQATGNTWNRLDLIEGTADVPEGEQGWASSGGVEWLLEPGERYAMGVYIESDWYYFYDEGRSGSPWFGTTEGSFRIEEVTPDQLTNPTDEDYFYWMQVVSEDADLDGDGIIGLDYGGEDCDDTDPNVGASTEEIPYDGIDQDCDGTDLTDGDGDGVDGVDAGGGDCEDEDSSVFPGADEVCGDGIDNDCSGGDADCSGDGDGSGNSETTLTASGGCACAVGSKDVVWGLGALVGLVGLRRRK